MRQFLPGKPKAKKEKATSTGQSSYQLNVLGGSARPNILSFAGRNSVKIGKAANSDIVTPGLFIAANQCFINMREDGFYIIPQSGFIKTKLNGTSLRSPEKLHPGDLISIRSHQIRFEQLT